MTKETHDMSEYYDIVEGTYPERSEHDGSVAEGDGWKVYPIDGHFLLRYISGGMSGESKSLEITKEDFEALKSGTATLDSICIKYDVT